MKYSAVIVAALASGAMARAVPDVPSDAGAPVNTLNDDPVLAGAPKVPGGRKPPTVPVIPKPQPTDYTKPTEKPEYKPPTTDYKPKEPEYKPKPDYKPPTDYNKPAPKPEYKPADYTNSYGGYVQPKPKYGEKDDDFYVPTYKPSYEENKSKPDHKFYGPEPTEYKPKQECAKEFHWPENVEVNKPCKIEWAPYKPEYKKKYNVYLYRCDDYGKHYETVCKSCDKSYDWKPTDSCKPSNAKGSNMYRFKFCEEDDEDNFTWGCEFPIWHDDYFKDKKEDYAPEQCPKPAPPPPCPTAYPTSTAVPYTPAPAETAAPAPVAPAPYVAPPSNASAPVEAPVYTGASSTLRASFSAIVGVAALIAFAL